MEISQIRSSQVNTYLIRLQGALSSPTIDWFGDVTIITLDHDETFQISLTIDAASLRIFLEQFQDLSLIVLPKESIQPGDQI